MLPCLKKNSHNGGWWCLVWLLCLSLSTAEAQERDRYFELVQSLDIFSSLLKELNNNYVDELNLLSLIEETTQPMLRRLDPYTAYIPERQVSSYQFSHTDAYVGVGIQLGKREEGYFIQRLRPSSVAALAPELQVGHLLLAVNQIPVDNRSEEEVKSLLNGQVGQAVTLLLQPLKRHTATYTCVLLRKQENRNSVSAYQLLADGVGYVKLTAFTQTAGMDMQRALHTLKEAGAQAFIIDLRNNGGGLLREAVKVANFFVPNGAEIVHMRGRKTGLNKTYYAEHMPIDTQSPVVVLVNNASASASEIVSGVLQDYDRSLILGEKTYGKGLVQATVPLSYGAQLRVTTARYYTPSGRCIQATDYTPAVPGTAEASRSNKQKQRFYTKNGRPVYDRGGITPDILITSPPIHPLIAALTKQLLVFDYATTYCARHPILSNPNAFTLSKGEYLHFQTWLLNEPRTYQTPAFQALKQLQAALLIDSKKDALKSQLLTLEKALRTRIKEDIKQQKASLHRVLSREIAARYHRKVTEQQAVLHQDPYVLQAQQVLNDTTRYAGLLNK